jgi:hypothetical protein
MVLKVGYAKFMNYFGVELYQWPKIYTAKTSTVFSAIKLVSTDSSV